MKTARFLGFWIFLLLAGAVFAGKPALAAIADVRVTDFAPSQGEAELTSYDRRFTLTLPASAITQPVRAEVTTHTSDSLPVPAGYRVLGGVYQFRVHQTLANAPAEYPVRISWTETDDVGADLFYWDAGKEVWKQLYGFGLTGSHQLQSVLPSGFSQIAVMVPPPVMMQGQASWYAYKNCDCAASPDYAKGSKLRVSRIDDPTRFVIVTVNDFGPERDKHPDRVIDLDLVAFKKIANPRGGLVEVRVDPL